ncbi:hypothetical protein V1478_001591 [Vespula squamosa]|uniref:Uncharacterized protein n=1 Tax=Vespula squamosa TaxID=30214 RepID=A0ABD2C1X2_VESSQ
MKEDGEDEDENEDDDDDEGEEEGAISMKYEEEYKQLKSGSICKHDLTFAKYIYVYIFITMLHAKQGFEYLSNNFNELII